jgi:hypothetical protein
VKKDKPTISVDRKGWSLVRHFFNTLTIAFSSICLLLSALMWLSVPDPGKMAHIILSLFS